jgi:uncharacterized RDD family membrane protein YckC
LGAILYDAVIVLGVLAVVGLLTLPFLRGKLPIPAEIGVGAYALRAVQLLLIAAFFCYFWTQRGQTVGMLAWRLRIASQAGGSVGWGQCLLRLATLGVLLLPYFVGDWLWFSRWSQRWRSLAHYAAWLPLVACYAWIWIDREQRAWHDRLSGTRLWLLPKRARSP